MIRSFYENRLINSLSGGILFLFGKKNCPDSDESGVNRKKTVKKGVGVRSAPTLLLYHRLIKRW